MSETGNLYLDRALMSVHRQSAAGEHEIEFVVGMDSPIKVNAANPIAAATMGMQAFRDQLNTGLLPERFKGVTQVFAGAGGQAAAVNAAVRASTGDVLAFLEDDDIWCPEKLAAQIPWLSRVDMVTSNQREVDVAGNFQRVNDFATPSGWLMHRAVWDEIGPMDEGFRFHVDTEWLGRANKHGVKRAHLVDEDAPVVYFYGQPLTVRHGWLQNISRHSVIVNSGDREPLVIRTTNPAGGMAMIQGDLGARQQSEEEHRQMLSRFGEIPW